MALVALGTGASDIDVVNDFRSRFEEFKALDSNRNTLVQALIDRLDAVTRQLHHVSTVQVAELEADLRDQKESRRMWQHRAIELDNTLHDMDNGRFVSVLIDADADIYYFTDDLLARGLQGGQVAADKLMEKIKEHLSSLGSAIRDARNIPIIVKAYANLSGLTKHFKERGITPSDVHQFWAGFTQRFPLMDFVDVGYGKEVADNKIKEVLRLNINNPQCEHILLACGHDGGYVPVLSPYAGQAASSRRIALISAGAGSLHPTMAALGFPTTEIFKPLFSPSDSPRVINWATKEPPAPAEIQAQAQLQSPPQQQAQHPIQVEAVSNPAEPSRSSSWATKAQISPIQTQKEIDRIVTPTIDISGQTPGTSKTSSGHPFNPHKKDYTGKDFVANAGRLIPTSVDSNGHRLRDNKLIVDRRLDYDLINAMKKKSLCQWNYLRSDCTNPNCKRNHDTYPRPLAPKEYDALWFLARLGKCNSQLEKGVCEDEYCIYGHEFDA